MISIGIIADTHGLLRPEVPRVFAGVHLIVHAGDVGGRAVLDGLSKIARVEAVYGNVDDPHDPSLARERIVKVGDIIVHVQHGHELGRPTPQLALTRYAGDIVIFGHTHRAVVLRGDDNRIAVNPGAAGPRRFDVEPSVARLTIRRGRVDVEIVPLLRG